MDHSAEALRGRLLAGPTASAVLVDWCTLRFGPGCLTVRILEDRAAQNGKRCRRVELRWQDVTVSSAENIYIPSGLPECVRSQMLDSAVPFGVLLGDAGLVRRTTLARVLPGGDPFVLEIRATLALPGRGNVASVHEFYHRELLA